MHLGLPRACQAGRAPVCPETSEATSRRPEAIRRLRLFAAKKNSVISLVTYSESICTRTVLQLLRARLRNCDCQVSFLTGW